MFSLAIWAVKNSRNLRRASSPASSMTGGSLQVAPRKLEARARALGTHVGAHWLGVVGRGSLRLGPANGHAHWAFITHFMCAQYNILCGGTLDEIQGLPLGAGSPPGPLAAQTGRSHRRGNGDKTASSRTGHRVSRTPARSTVAQMRSPCKFHRLSDLCAPRGPAATNLSDQTQSHFIPEEH